MSIRGRSLALGSKPRLLTRVARSGLRKRLGSKLPQTSVCLKLVRRILDSSQSSLHLYASSIDRWRLDPHLGQEDDEKERGKGKRRLLIFLIPINPRAHLLRASLNLVPRVFSFSNRAEKTQRTRLVLPLLKKLG